MSKEKEILARLEEFREQYDDVLVEGLDGTKDYVVLHRGEKTHVAVRPMVSRIAFNVVLLLKVKVAYNSPDTDAGADDLLDATAFPAEFWDTVDKSRARRLYGLAFTASPYQYAEFKEALNLKDYTKKLVESLVEAGDFKVQEPMKAYTAIARMYEILLPSVFKKEPPNVEVGTVSEDASTNVNPINIVDFLEHVAQSEPAEGTDEEEESTSA